MKYYGNELLWHYMERAYKAMMNKEYVTCQIIVDEGLERLPEDSNLNLYKAVLSRDTKYMKYVKEDELLLDTLKACVDCMIEINGKHFEDDSHELADAHLSIDKSYSTKVYVKKIVYSVRNALTERKILHKRSTLVTILFFLSFLINMILVITIAVWILQ